MLKIAVCEDESIWEEQLLQILHSIKTNGELQIQTFHYGEDLLHTYSYGKFDLIFMDIYMKTLNGIETVTKLREIDKDVPVAFVTTSPDYALAAYRLNVMKYLEKPIKKSDVLDCLTIAELSKKNRKQITLLISGRERSFSEDEFLYLEQQNHTVLFHLAHGDILSCSGKLDDYSNSLPTPPFYRCHKSFLVNLANVIRLDHNMKVFTMKDGSNAYIKRDKVKEAELQLEQFLFAQLRKNL